eukprot:TRINITY_DN59582_c0_g1_i1.p1 TRINITY_DN59582_c0_g1~~TRINITY_DN59582_c0_g1_i1.p1  ORF type:complete len:157 (+),score=11.76 TRINITY_DN59582_c0_g1_i1:219-689(+)
MEASAETTAQMSFLLQLGHLAGTRYAGERRRTKSRLLHAVSDGGSVDSEQDVRNSDAVLAQWLRWARMPRATAETVRFTCDDATCSLRETNPEEARNLISRSSDGARMIITPLPNPPASSDLSGVYVEKLHALTKDLPPMLLVINGNGTPVISTDV